MAPHPDQLQHARLALAERDPALRCAHEALPPVQWRMRPGGFEGLVKMVVEQQVSTAAAAAIWRRFAEGLGSVTPNSVLARRDAELRSFGLSAPKARYARIIAEACSSGELDFEVLPRLEDEAAIAALVSIKGVGRWTAETYLMFCEGRLDVFPAGDVALQEAVRLAEGAPARLSEKALYARAEPWRPWRGVAAHLLWAYYGAVRRGEVQPAAEAA